VNIQKPVQRPYLFYDSLTLALVHDICPCVPVNTVCNGCRWDADVSAGADMRPDIIEID
jgi:hypothetical protein